MECYKDIIITIIISVNNIFFEIKKSQVYNKDKIYFS